MKTRSLFLTALVLAFAAINISAQFEVRAYSGALSTTWNNPFSGTASVLIQNAMNRQMLERSIANKNGKYSPSRTAGRRPASPASAQNGSPAANYKVLRFRPAAKSRTLQLIANAIGSSPQERADTLAVLQTVKKSYESEAAASGNSNDLAAALTFFLVADSMAYHQTGPPADKVTDALLMVLHQELSSLSDFKTMTNLQKQEMHDWLVAFGGLVAAGYLDAVKTNDEKELADYKELANSSFKLVFGSGPEMFNLAEIDLP